MNATPLAIIQARLSSTRLPRKVMLEIDGKPLIRRVWEATVEAVGAMNTVVAVPVTDSELRLYLAEIGAQVFAWDGDENDVLGRFYHCAHLYRWHPDTTILRVTADDPHKDPVAMQRVILGERLPVELGGEAFTLAMLDAAFMKPQSKYVRDAETVTLGREHLTHLLFDTPPPTPPPGKTWTIDTQEDLDAVRAEIGGRVMSLADATGTP